MLGEWVRSNAITTGYLAVAMVLAIVTHYCA